MADSRKRGRAPTSDDRNLKQLQLLPDLGRVEKRLAELRARRLEGSIKTNNMILRMLAPDAHNNTEGTQDQAATLEEIERRLEQLNTTESAGGDDSSPDAELRKVITEILDGGKAIDKLLEKLAADVNAVKI